MMSAESDRHSCSVPAPDSSASAWLGREAKTPERTPDWSITSAATNTGAPTLTARFRASLGRASTSCDSLPAVTATVA